MTGTHNIKMGFQNWFGPVEDSTERNGDLALNYVNGRPQTVTVYNTPGRTMGHVDNDFGLYVQDSWTINRLTINPGIRVEWFNSSMRETSMEAGRFAPGRFYTRSSRTCRTGGRTGRRGSARRTTCSGTAGRRSR